MNFINTSKNMGVGEFSLPAAPARKPTNQNKPTQTNHTNQPTNQLTYQPNQTKPNQPTKPNQQKQTQPKLAVILLCSTQLCSASLQK